MKTAGFNGTWRLHGMKAPWKSAAVTDVAFHSMYWKGHQSKLFVVHSKGGRCNFWGMLHWLRCPEMILNVSMIAVALTLSWLVWILTIMLVWLHFSWFLFCFWTRKFIHYTSVSCFLFLLPYVSLQSHWAWKLSKFGLSISFSLRGFSSLLTLL